MKTFLTRKRIAAAAAAGAVLVGAVAAASARSDAGPEYRTAVAGMQSVDQILNAVATIEPVSQATVAFPVAGTVDSVDVEVGQEVTIGQRLASLDVADLQVALNEKQAALDQAELTLELALAGEDVGSVSGGGTPGGGFGRAVSTGGSAELAAAQQAVLDAQQAVDEASAAAQVAFEHASAVCSSESVAAATEGESTTTTAASPGSASCLTALQAVLDAQTQVTAAQQRLTEAAVALTALLEDLADDPGTTPTVPTPTTPTTPDVSGVSGDSWGTGGAGGSGGSEGSSGATPSGATDGASGSSTSPSAEDLIAFQKKVDAAADELAVAEQAIDQATVVSPIDGRVASVGLAVGDEVEAGSATANIVVVGEGGYEVTTSISVKDLPDVEVGQPATVSPDGDPEAVEGEVVRIGVTADTSGTTATYPVTIALTGDTSAMGNGATASVVIVTSAAAQALAVPTSAVSVDGDRATVQVVTDGAAQAVTVETGAIGQTWTEITDGIDEGDEVVLADVSEPLPGSATDGSSSAGSGERPFPGGGSFTGPPAGVVMGGRPGN